MADLLCWPIEYVAGVNHNALPESKKGNLSDPKILEKWQAAEIKLYDEMYKKFQERLENFGRVKMSEEVEKLRKIQQNLEKTCDIKHYNVENQTKDEKLKYQYSAPYNKNGIHYIAGYVIDIEKD